MFNFGPSVCMLVSAILSLAAYFQVCKFEIDLRVLLDDDEWYGHE